MELYTAQEVMDFWDSNATQEAKAEKAEIEAIQKDIDTAQKYIRDALARYRKDKTRSRSKAKGADPFAELEKYTSREDIHEAFGWGIISEEELDRLWNLWDLREESKSKTVLENRVTEMLQIAMRAVSQPYDEKLIEYHQKRSKMWKQAEKIAMENLRRR